MNLVKEKNKQRGKHPKIETKPNRKKNSQIEEFIDREATNQKNKQRKTIK